MSLSAHTPILVGVGQYTERLDATDYRALSSVELAVEASRKAIADVQATQSLEPHIDCIVTTRTFEDSSPMLAQPFGKSNNYPGSIAKRLGISPTHAVWDYAGGDSPQRLINEFCGKLAQGSLQMVLLAGAENISTARALAKSDKKVDWSETLSEPVEDRGMGLKGLITQYAQTHKLRGAPTTYALFEQARRGRLQQSREAYQREMGRLFAPFTTVAAANPYAAFAAKQQTTDELVTISDRNRWIADPYPLNLVARDQVNQAAAVILTTVGKAQALGIPQERWVFLHGHCDLREREILERQDLSRSQASQLSCQTTLQRAGLKPADISFFDFYSCFPIAVFNAACDGMGLSPDDPRGLTVTGGLPFFGGPGNNYSMHAVATMVEKLRAQPGSFGFVGANGGHMSKYSAGIYSTQPKDWEPVDNQPLQALVNAWPAPAVDRTPNGPATIETYTIVYEKGVPAYALIVGRLQATNARFYANTIDGDSDTLQSMLDNDPLRQIIHVRNTPKGNRFTFSQDRLDELLAEPPVGWRDQYAHCIVERKGHLLEVTINRPEARNSLTPQAHEELSAIFDAYEADPDMWVAILTGAGTDAFCTGQDLKYAASGKPIWIPRSGFAGLALRDRSKPVIAAVNGFAMGGGLETCLACDIVVADESAQFALSEVKVGLFAGAGGVVRLPRQIPKKIAYELILTGRRFSAQEAMRLGLISRIASKGNAMEAAREIAAEILEASPTAVRLSLRAMNEAQDWPSDMEALVNRSPEIVDELFSSEDFFEGPMSFAQKRKPNWKNR